MSKNTKVPRTIDEAHAEIDKALDEINTAQGRIRKAACRLIHEGNTVSQTSAHSHYAVALADAHPYFTRIRLVMRESLADYKKEQQA